MSKLIIEGNALPNMPWQDRPADSNAPMWRYSENPIIPRDLLPTSNSIFNSAVVPFGNCFAGVFRCDDTNRRMVLHVGFSDDGLHWDIDPNPLRFECEDKEIGEWVYGYDPRVTFIEDRYYVTWCNGYHGPTIGVAWTKDFKTFHQLENAFLPYNRNGVLFPRKINGRFAMLSRPSDTGHTPFGDIFYSESPDMEFWGRHRHVMAPAAFEKSAWQCMKIGAGPIPSRRARDGCCSTMACSIAAMATSIVSARRSSTATSPGSLSTEVAPTSSRRRNSTSVWATCPTSASPVPSSTTLPQDAWRSITVAPIP